MDQCKDSAEDHTQNLKSIEESEDKDCKITISENYASESC